MLALEALLETPEDAPDRGGRSWSRSPRCSHVAVILQLFVLLWSTIFFLSSKKTLRDYNAKATGGVQAHKKMEARVGDSRGPDATASLWI